MRTALVTNPGHEQHEYPGHPERPARVQAALRGLESTGLRSRMVELDTRAASANEVTAVHPPEVWQQIEQIAAAGGGSLDADTYVRPASPAVALEAAGAAVVCIEAVLSGSVDNAFAVVRPPGHHAEGPNGLPVRGRVAPVGFCLLNNAAIAVAAALRAGLERVAVLDWDVHHGNGTEAIFGDDPAVLYTSTHASPFYPGTGAADPRSSIPDLSATLNVPLPHGSGDAEIIAAYEQLILPAIERFRPQLIVVSCGWDAHERDPLAPLAVSSMGYARIVELAVDAARRLCDDRIVLLLEGGYDEQAIAECTAAAGAALLGDRPDPNEVSAEAEGNARPSAPVARLIAEQRAARGLVI